MFSALTLLSSLKKADVQVLAEFHHEPVCLGDKLSGILTIRCDRAIKVGYVAVEVKCVGYCKWPEEGSEGEPTSFYIQHNEYFKTKPKVLLEARPNGIAIMDSQSVNFAVKVPYGDFPSSEFCYVSGIGNPRIGERDQIPGSNVSRVHYSCIFSIYSLRKTLIAKKDVTFNAVAHHTYKRGLFPMYSVIHFVFYGCLCFDAVVKARVHMAVDKSVYVPGDTIQVLCWADDTVGDWEGMPTTVEFYRINTIFVNSNGRRDTWRGSSTSRRVIEKLFLIESKSVEMLNGQRVSESFTIPTFMTATFGHVAEASCSWQYEIRLVIAPHARVKHNKVKVCVVVNSAVEHPVVRPPRSLPSECLRAQDLYTYTFPETIAPVPAVASVSPTVLVSVTNVDSADIVGSVNGRTACVTDIEEAELAVPDFCLSSPAYQPVVGEDIER